MDRLMDRKGGIGADTFPAAVREKVVAGTGHRPALVEQYRKLAATLHHARGTQDVKVVLVASALMAEGKTLTASNLALTLSESFRRLVLLIDADLRRPSIHTVFNIPNERGLSDLLKGDAPSEWPLFEASAYLRILPAGLPDPDPMSGLTSARMQALLHEAVATFEWVIIDTPPIALLTDANLLARLADLAVVVVRAGSTPYRLVQRAVSGLGPDRIAGIVLNCVDERTVAGGYGYGSYYTAHGAHDRAK